MNETSEDLKDVYTGDDPTAVGGQFEHYNSQPDLWSGMMICVSRRPQPMCTCGRYILHWDEHWKRTKEEPA